MLWREISARRAHNMLEFAVDLRATGQLRPDLSDQQVAAIVWSMNAAEYWILPFRSRSVIECARLGTAISFHQ